MYINSLKAVVGDYNGDGFADLFVSHLSSSVSEDTESSYLLISDGLRSFKNVSLPAETHPVLPSYNIELCSACDFNADGRADVLKMSFLYNSDASEFTNFTLHALLSLEDTAGFDLNSPSATSLWQSWYWESLKAFTDDFNGDGKCDVILYDQFNFLELFYIDQGGQLVRKSSSEIGIELDIAPNLVVGDFNGDGNHDLLFIDYDFESKKEGDFLKTSQLYLSSPQDHSPGLFVKSSLYK